MKTLKLLSVVFLILISLATMLTVTHADEVEIESTYQTGDVVYTLYSDMHLTVTGNGEVPSGTYGQNQKIKSVYIGNGITKIGNTAFWLCNNLEKVEFEPGSQLTSIGKQAFSYCPKLASFTIPDSVISIELAALSYCPKLTGLKLESENSNFKLDSGCLYDRDMKTLYFAYNLQEIEFVVPEGVETIIAYAFSNCSNLTKLVLPKSVQKINTLALNSCNSLQELVLPFVGIDRETSGKSSAVFGSIFGTLGVSGDSVSISGGVVQRYAEVVDKTNSIGCFIPSSLRKVTITDETVIPYGAFHNCTMLTDITLSGTITEIMPYAFKNCMAKLTYNGTESAWQRIYKHEEIDEPDLYTDLELISSAPTVIVEDVINGKAVYVSSVDENAKIYYSVESTNLTYTDRLYEGEVVFDTEGSFTFSAVSAKPGYDLSETVSQSFTLERVLTPTSSLPSGATGAGAEVTLSCETEGAQIYYTLNGEVPTTESTEYDGAFRLNDSAKLSVLAVKPGYVNSTVSEYTYVLEYVVPMVTTNDATMVSKNSAVLSCNIDNISELGEYRTEFIYYAENAPDQVYNVIASSDLTATIDGLKEDTEYCFYARVINGDKTADGEILRFKTKTYEIPLSISLSRKFVRVPLGNTYRLEASVLPETAKNKGVIWSSSDASVATVDENGFVSAVGEGEAVITVTTEECGLEAICKIIVFEKNIAGEYDFSEMNLLTNTRAFAENAMDVHGEGGQNELAMAYMANWDGVVLESRDKYYSSSLYDLEDLYIELEADFHLQNAYILPARKNLTDNDEIKNAIMKYGAVSAPMMIDSAYFGGDNYSNYYYNGDDVLSGNHLVTLVGWDDDYPASSFRYTPPGDGAFIVKNSWGSGTGKGDNGYFYISYYDEVLCNYSTSMVFPYLESKDNYNTIWQYDDLGPSNKIGYKGSTYAANVFPESSSALEKDELLKAVSFYTVAQNTYYEIYVVDNYVDSSSLVTEEDPVMKGTFFEMGYHTVDLAEDIKLSAGTRFAVIVKLSVSDPNAKANMLFEMPVKYFSRARANSDESYISADGTSWIDLTSKIKNANMCIKAFTDSFDYQPNTQAYSAIDNYNRQYESDKVYDLSELSELECEVYSSAVYSESTEDIFSGYDFHYIGVDTFRSSFVSEVELPSKYDLRELGQVTPVKNQGGYGSCWAFSVYASLESGLLKRAADANTDEVVLYGDVDSDGEVSTVDSVYLSRYLAHWDGYETVNEVTADVDDDGEITTIDSVVLSRYFAKWDGYTVLPLKS